MTSYRPCSEPASPRAVGGVAARMVLACADGVLPILAMAVGEAARADAAQGQCRSRAPGRARLLGPAAAPGAAGPVAHQRDPVSDRDRLPAVQFHRAGRQPGRVQCRSGARHLRRDQGHLHRPDAPFRDPARCDFQQPGRCHHRLDRGDAADARPRRFLRSLLPGAGALRVAPRRGAAGDPAGISRRQEDRRRRGLGA